MCIRRLSILLSIALLTGAAAVPAQTVINSVPYTINVSGKYILGGNVSTTNPNQNAIRITVANVDLDLNGFFVACSAPNTSSSLAAIFVSDVGNVTIRNGTVAAYAYGISFGGSSNSRNYLVENVTISRVWLHGLYFASPAPGSQVRNNSFSDIGGYTNATNAQTEAILSRGGVRIENNNISNVTGIGTSPGVGISAASTDFTIGNTISNATIGISGGKYLNNLTAGCSTSFTGGTNATGNN